MITTKDPDFPKYFRMSSADYVARGRPESWTMSKPKSMDELTPGDLDLRDPTVGVPKMVMKRALYLMYGSDNGTAVFKFDHIVEENKHG